MRAAKDEYMRDAPSSPLGKQEQSSFKGLKYYPYDPSLALELPLDRDVDSEPVQMGTSTGDSRDYSRVGKIHFEVRGVPAEATLYGEPEQPLSSDPGRNQRKGDVRGGPLPGAGDDGR